MTKTNHLYWIELTTMQLSRMNHKQKIDERLEGVQKNSESYLRL